MNVIEKIEQSGYNATEAQVEAMAMHMAGATDAAEAAGGTYLRVLCFHTIAALKPRARALRVLETTAKPLYEAVKRGILKAKPEIAKAEGLSQEDASRRALARNQRSNFARSSLSMVRGWVEAGGDLRTVDPKTVTKDFFRVEGAAQPAVKRFARARASVLASVGDMTPAQRRDAINALIVELRAQLPGSRPRGAGTGVESRVH